MPAAFSQSALTITVPGAVPVRVADGVVPFDPVVAVATLKVPAPVLLLSMENLMVWPFTPASAASLADAVSETAAPTWAIVSVDDSVSVEPVIWIGICAVTEVPRMVAVTISVRFVRSAAMDVASAEKGMVTVPSALESPELVPSSPVGALKLTCCLEIGT